MLVNNKNFLIINKNKLNQQYSNYKKIIKYVLNK